MHLVPSFYCNGCFFLINYCCDVGHTFKRGPRFLRLVNDLWPWLCCKFLLSVSFGPFHSSAALLQFFLTFGDKRKEAWRSYPTR